MSGRERRRTRWGADLRGQRWIAVSSSGADGLTGVWPGLRERPEIAHTARDRQAGLHPVAPW
ncbi:hypothetical protein [Streptomyces sp. 6-11-2]|uniref:hypothetical protein n=1 Tax=Streptomyces sp. 6-11-2 TaxID=2585753 RepID=UPI001C0F0811